MNDPIGNERVNGPNAMKLTDGRSPDIAAGNAVAPVRCSALLGDDCSALGVTQETKTPICRDWLNPDETMQENALRMHPLMSDWIEGIESAPISANLWTTKPRDLQKIVELLNRWIADGRPRIDWPTVFPLEEDRRTLRQQMEVS